MNSLSSPIHRVGASVFRRPRVNYGADRGAGPVRCVGQRSGLAILHGASRRRHSARAQSHATARPHRLRGLAGTRRKRHLLRLWLAPVKARPLRPVFTERYGSVIPGQRGGIVVPGMRYTIPWEARATVPFPVNTRAVAGRRVLHLDTLDDLSQEVNRVIAATAAGRVRPLGNWSSAQVLWHLGRLIEFSVDGFPFRYNWALRAACRILSTVSWRWCINLAFRPGFRNPRGAQALEPDPSVSLEAAATFLREQIARIPRGARMTQPSPTGERVSHEQWIYVHLRHAELHLSFLQIDSS